MSAPNTEKAGKAATIPGFHDVIASGLTSPTNPSAARGQTIPALASLNNLQQVPAARAGGAT